MFSLTLSLSHASPANRKQAQHLQAQIVDLEKKDLDLEASAASLRARFATQCSDMKIQVRALSSSFLTMSTHMNNT